jgi:hypothetical protein
LHQQETLLPVLEQSFLGHDDALDFDCCLFQSVAGGSGLFFLGDELGLVKSLLLVQTLDLLVH